MAEKEQWLKKCLLLNLGFVPKLFGYTDENLYRLATGRIGLITSGVEYYFGITLKGTEQSPKDFPRKLVKNHLIKVLHAPFSKTPYPFPLSHRIKTLHTKNIYRSLRYRILARADDNPWHRLPKAIDLASRIKTEKINIHTLDIVLAPHSSRLFRELDILSRKKRVVICLENTILKLSERKFDKPEWTIAHNPIKLIEHLRKNNFDHLRLTLDTAHLAASGYNVLQVWNGIKRFTGNDINSSIGHFHLVDYDERLDFDAETLGKGAIGIETFRTIIDDLYKLNYTGTISLEVAPLYFKKGKLKLAWKIFKRMLSPTQSNLEEEENYILEMIEGLL